MNIVDINIEIYSRLPNNIEEMDDLAVAELLYDLAMEYYDLKTTEDFTEFFTKFQELPHSKPQMKEKLNLKGVVYEALDFDKMTAGQYIDLDFYCKEFEYAKRFMSIIYRVSHLEPYTGTNEDSMDGIGILEYKGAINAYNEWKKEYVKMFPYLYEESDSTDEEEETEDEVKFLTDEAQFAEEYGWYPMLFLASGENFLKIDEVTAKPATEFLYFVNFLKRKHQLDNNRIKSARKQ